MFNNFSLISSNELGLFMGFILECYDFSYQIGLILFSVIVGSGFIIVFSKLGGDLLKKGLKGGLIGGGVAATQQIVKDGVIQFGEYLGIGEPTQGSNGGNNSGAGNSSSGNNGGSSGGNSGSTSSGGNSGGNSGGGNSSTSGNSGK